MAPEEPRRCYSCGQWEGSFDDAFEELITFDDNGLCSSCRHVRDEEGDDSDLVSYYSCLTIKIGEKSYPSIRRSGSTQLCSECGRPIYGVPFLIWGHGGQTIIAFCHECAETHAIPFMEKRYD
jgi:hypothetical protein